MKKLALATTALSLLAGGAAMAADMPVKVEHHHRECAADKFAGGYIGVNGGAAYHTAYR